MTTAGRDVRPFARDETAMDREQVIVSDVMSTRSATVGSGVTIEVALRMLDTQALAALSVVDEGGRVLGVINESDLVRSILSGAGDNGTGPGPGSGARVVDELMSCYPLVLRPGYDLAVAVALMTSTGVKSLPVTDGEGHAVGMLTRADVVRLLAHGDPQVESEAFRLLATVGLGEWLLDLRGYVIGLQGQEGATGSASRAALSLARTVPAVLAVRTG